MSQDEGAVLLCVAQGCPSVEYRWYTQNGPEPLPVLTGPRIRLLGPVLAIEAVTTDDAGSYKCSASNAGGEASAELKLTVATSIQVEITPNVLSVNMGGSTEFRCLVTSNGASVSTQQISWFKDGRQLPTSGRNGDTLLLSSVGREDKGMYQCVVRRQEGDTFQASAELQLGGTRRLSHSTRSSLMISPSSCRRAASLTLQLHRANPSARSGSFAEMFGDRKSNA